MKVDIQVFTQKFINSLFSCEMCKYKHWQLQTWWLCICNLVAFVFVFVFEFVYLNTSVLFADKSVLAGSRNGGCIFVFVFVF